MGVAGLRLPFSPGLNGCGGGCGGGGRCWDWYSDSVLYLWFESCGAHSSTVRCTGSGVVGGYVPSGMGLDGILASDAPPWHKWEQFVMNVFVWTCEDTFEMRI